MPLAIFRRLASWRPGRLAWSTAHAGAWNAVRVILQAASLVLMARNFGASSYGSLAGSVALYTTCAQLAGLGAGTALVRHLALQGELHGKFRSTQQVYLLTSVILFAFAWPVSIWVLDGALDSATLALLAAAELIAAPALLPLVYRYQAEERLSVSGGLLTITPIARFVAVVSAFALDLHDLRSFAVLYLAGIGIAVAVALWWFWPRRQVAARRYRLADTIGEGAPFVVSGLAVTAGSELDKTIMLRSAGDFAAGQYSAAYRVIQAGLLPVNSLVLAVTPRLFQAAGHSPRTGTILVLSAAAYALLAATGVWLIAPYLPLLLGAEFIPSISILRAMCVLLLTGSLRQIIVAQLTGADRQRARNWIEGLAAAGSVVAMLAVVPAWGAWGAICVLAVADVFVAGMSWLSLASAHDVRRRPQGTA